MATLSVSPRRPLSQEEKKQRDSQYKVEVKDFGKVLKNHVQIFNAIIQLHAALCSAGKGSYLVFQVDDRQIPFNRKHMRSAIAKFSRELLKLKHFLRVSKKKTRDQVRPESFSGTYTPVFAGDALRAFFNSNPANFGPLGPIHLHYGNDRDQADQFIYTRIQGLQAAVDQLNQVTQAFQNLQVPGEAPPRDATKEQIDAYQGAVQSYQDARNAYYSAQDYYNKFANLSAAAADGETDVRTIGDRLNNALMDSLPQAKQGFLLRNTSTMLFYIYAHAYVDPATGQQGLQAADNAQFARSDEAMMAAFGGRIPAAFFSYRGNDGKPVKITMSEAVNRNIVDRPLNTYEVITSMYQPGVAKNNKGQDVGFDPARFNTYYYQNIAAANYYSKAALAADPNLAGQANVLADQGIRQAMLQEHNIVKAVSEEWHDLLEPGRKVQREARKKQNDAKNKQAKLAVNLM